jgi:hypothetical protein
MECLSSTSLRLLLANCMQTFWGPKIENKIDEDLEQTIPNAANLYRLTEPAIYEPENTKSTSSLERPLPVSNPQTEKGEASQISLIRDCYSEFFLYNAKLLIMPSHSATLQKTDLKRTLYNQTATQIATSLCSLASLQTFDLSTAGLLIGSEIHRFLNGQSHNGKKSIVERVA